MRENNKNRKGEQTMTEKSIGVETHSYGKTYNFAKDVYLTVFAEGGMSLRIKNKGKIDVLSDGLLVPLWLESPTAKKLVRRYVEPFLQEFYPFITWEFLDELNSHYRVINVKTGKIS